MIEGLAFVAGGFQRCGWKMAPLSAGIDLCQANRSLESQAVTCGSSRARFFASLGSRENHKETDHYLRSHGLLIWWTWLGASSAVSWTAPPGQ